MVALVQKETELYITKTKPGKRIKDNFNISVGLLGLRSKNQRAHFKRLRQNKVLLKQKKNTH